MAEAADRLKTIQQTVKANPQLDRALYQKARKLKLRQLVDTDLAALNAKLDASQAPWTPGRKIPDWK